MVGVKVCGITTLEDALNAARMGADALGFVFAPSPRRVTADQVRSIVSRLPESVTTVGVFVNAPVQEISALRTYCGLDVIQLHGDEPEEFVAALDGQIIKAVRACAASSDQGACREVGAGFKPAPTGGSEAYQKPYLTERILVSDRLHGYASATILLDTHCGEARGGTGKAFDWRQAVEAARRRPVILAGGLSPDNVAEAIADVAPCGVDVCSGVESEPGRKDYARMSRFIRTAKSVGSASRWAWPFRPVRRQVCA